MWWICHLEISRSIPFAPSHAWFTISCKPPPLAPPLHTSDAQLALSLVEKRSKSPGSGATLGCSRSVSFGTGTRGFFFAGAAVYAEAPSPTPFLAFSAVIQIGAPLQTEIHLQLVDNTGPGYRSRARGARAHSVSRSSISRSSKSSSRIMSAPGWRNIGPGLANSSEESTSSWSTCHHPGGVVR